MSNERVAIFIDGSNLYHSLQADYGTAAIDFEKFIQTLCAGRKLMRAYYYNAPRDQTSDPDKYNEQQKFFDRLRKVPYLQVELGRLEKHSGAWVEKGVDVSLAVDMLELAYRNAYDTAIIVSGDADFARVAEAVKSLGKHVENAFCHTGQSRRLREACDRFILLDSDYMGPIFL
ncbi:MAG: NYN domain-containing protein [Chloroflexi bacterium]|nr:NYN domain-containing protein [Chloroflexota bacterium]